MTSVGIMSAAVLVGLGGASTAYELASGDEPTAPSQSPFSVAPQAKAPVAKVRWAPCDPPAELRGRVCVTDVVRTVVLPGAAVAVGSAGAAARPGHDALDDHGGDRDRDDRHEAGDDRDDHDRIDGDDDHDAFDDHGGARDRDDRHEAGDDRDDDRDDDDRDDMDDRDDDDRVDDDRDDS